MPLKMGVRGCLILGCTLLLTLQTGMSGFMLMSVTAVSDLTVQMYEHPLTVTRSSQRAHLAILRIHDALIQLPAADDSTAQELSGRISDWDREAHQELNTVFNRILGQGGKELCVEVVTLVDQLSPMLQEVIARVARGERAAAQALVSGTVEPHLAATDKKMQSLVEYADTKAQGFFNSAIADASNTRWITVSVIVAALLGSGVIAFSLIRIITGRIRGLQERIEAIEANADLSVLIPVRVHDAIGLTTIAFNKMLTRFKGIVSEVLHVVQQLETAAGEVADTAEHTCAGVSKQYVELEHLGSAASELAATAKEVASNATQAVTASREADEGAQLGVQVVATSMSAISELASELDLAAQAIRDVKNGSADIVKVLDVVRSIAEQTNLLALNASIEAARAGEHGRGFAVVADEVRSLAGRTQSATKEIESMISRLRSGAENAVCTMEQSRQHAQASVANAARAQESFRAVTGAITLISNMNEQIAGAVAEQSLVISQFDKMIEGIRGIGEQTSQGATRTNSMSVTFRNLTGRLNASVGQFKVG